MTAKAAKARLLKTKALLYAKSLPYVEPMGYGLGKSGWVGVTAPKGALPIAMFEEWIDESYANVAQKRKTAAVTTSHRAGTQGRRPRA